jgi:hypothetical protein
MHTISCWGWWYVLLVGWAWEKGRGGILCMYITFVSSLIVCFFFPVLVVFLLGHIFPSFFSYDNSYCNVNSRAYFTQFYRIYICIYIYIYIYVCTLCLRVYVLCDLTIYPLCVSKAVYMLYPCSFSSYL